jgi:hypothetical protein
METVEVEIHRSFVVSLSMPRPLASSDNKVKLVVAYRSGGEGWGVVGIRM